MCKKVKKFFNIKGDFKMSVLNKKTIEDIQVAGKKVLVRCDFNVKMENGVITSDKRVVASLPTIKYLLLTMQRLSFAHTLADPRVNSIPNSQWAPLQNAFQSISASKLSLQKTL